MKRHLVLEYRIRKLERLLFEDSFDDELDAMSDGIVKNNPNIDIDAELDKKAKDIIDKEPGYFYKNDPFGDHVKTYDTIEDWLDDKTVEIQLNPARPHKGDVVKDLNLLSFDQFLCSGEIEHIRATSRTIHCKETQSRRRNIIKLRICVRK